jgi:tetratricopeptide (TPR) repeat protein
MSSVQRTSAEAEKRVIVPSTNSGVEPSRSDIERLTAQAVALRQAAKRGEAAQAFASIARLLPDDWLAQYNAGAVLLEADRLDEAIDHLARALTLRASVAGHTLYAHALALRGDMSGAREAFRGAVRLAPHDFDANWGLFEVNQLLDDNASALRHQQIALAKRSLLSIPARVQPAHMTILEVCVAGTFQANIPLDFLFDRDRFSVHKLYLGEHPVPPLPPYDIVFNTIADAPDVAGALAAAQLFIAGQDRPALNAPHLVGLTSRDNVAELFAHSANVAVAQTQRTTREDDPQKRPPFPYLIRPLDSHAGNDLAKIDDAAALDAYLAATTHVREFYLSAFIDYRYADGYFRKYRIVFVDGVPFPVHLAISPRWKIHYYNAPMAENAWMREEEHAFMRDMDAVFAGVAAAGLREIANTIPLDYFGIDCAIAADGRVLLFEASTAMIVHLRDPVALYPYKVQYVPRIIRALEQLLDQRVSPKAER